MSGPDDEFEDFLRRRKPVFRSPDEMFEPPAELDRVVLRQAREAIEAERPLRVFRGPRWATPLAVAATLVLAITVIFHAGMPSKPALVPEVTVQNVAERVEIPAAAAPMAAAPSEMASSPARADMAADAAPPTAARERGMADATAKASEIPAWRHDPKTWLAEIERLRTTGDTARADAELAEFNRQQRAYAVGPDR